MVLAQAPVARHVFDRPPIWRDTDLFWHEAILCQAINIAISHLLTNADPGMLPAEDFSAVCAVVDRCSQYPARCKLQVGQRAMEEICELLAHLGASCVILVHERAILSSSFLRALLLASPIGQSVMSTGRSHSPASFCRRISMTSGLISSGRSFIYSSTDTPTTGEISRIAVSLFPFRAAARRIRQAGTVSD
jgi:hypothetical protein